MGFIILHRHLLRSPETIAEMGDDTTRNGLTLTIGSPALCGAEWQLVSVP